MKIIIKSKPFYKEYNKNFRTLVVNGVIVKNEPGFLKFIRIEKDGSINTIYF